MNLVIDCNQASKLPSHGKQPRTYSVSLPPFVLGEILLRSNPLPTLKCIQAYHFRIGLEPADVMMELSRLSLREIRNFEPFYSPRKHYMQDYDRLMEAAFKPGHEHRKWATLVKQRHLQFCNKFSCQSKPAKAKIKQLVRDYSKSAQQKGNAKPSNYKAVLADEQNQPNAFIKGVLGGSLSLYGCSSARLDEIYNDVMSNQYLNRFFRTIHAYFLGRSGAWRDQKLNFNPGPTQDDITDIILPLYAADGDIIVSEDKMLAKLVALVEVGNQVIVRKASQI